MKRFADVHLHMSTPEFDKCETFLNEIKAQNITDVCVNALTYRYMAYNLWLLYFKNHYKDLNISVFGMPNMFDGYYKDIPFDLQAKALINMGCDGIKLMFAGGTRKRLGYGIDNECLDKMFDYLEQNNIPVLVHTPDDDECWNPDRENTFADGPYLTKQELYNEAFNRLEKNPNLNIVFAHFFFIAGDYDEAVRIMETYKNVKFDITPGTNMYVQFSEDVPKWRGFFEKYSDRILYGTDANSSKSPDNHQLYTFTRALVLGKKDDLHIHPYWKIEVKGFELSEEAIKNITFNNYDNFIGTPKEVNQEMLIDCAKRMLDDIKKEEKTSDAMLGDHDGKLSQKWLEEFLEKFN